MTKHYIAWWNVENLFDVEDSPNRPAYLQSALKSELKGWSETILNQKIANLSTVIMAMNSGKGPDILGVCEVENMNVIQKLLLALAPLHRNYVLKHHDTQDNRGIDIAFFVDADLYEVEEKIFHYEVLKRAATRDIVQINTFTKKGTPLIIIGNHWPARSGGVYESEPYRIIAAETLSYWIERIVQIRGDKIAIIVLGDFNDEPYNRSLRDYAMSTPSRTRTNRGRAPYLYNLTEDLLPAQSGSYVFGNEQMFIDQILVSKGIAITTGPFDISKSAHYIFTIPAMRTGWYGSPTRFGRPSDGLNAMGFSDHVPVILELYEK